MKKQTRAERMTDEETYRAELAAMTFEQWLAHHRAAPGAWLTIRGTEEELRVLYATRLDVFDETEED